MSDEKPINLGDAIKKQAKVTNEQIDKIKAKVFSDHPELQERMGDVQKYWEDVSVRNIALENELAAARRCIWALVHARGGVIRIPDASMAIAGDEKNQIITSYNSKDKVTIFKSEMKQSNIVRLGD